MRTRSACVAILLAVSAGTTLTLSACTSDTTAPATVENPARVSADQKVKELEERYGWIGQYHTDGLAFVFMKLKENSARAKPDPYCKVAAKAVKEFHRLARKGEVPANLVDPSLISEICSEDEKGLSPNMNVLAGTPRVTADLSPATMSYMDQIATAISSATSRAALLTSLRSIEYAAVANLPYAEAGAVIGVVSIAISSMDYWEANLDAWVAMPGVIQVPYVRSGDSMTGISRSPLNVTPRWWTHPAIRAYLKIVGADAMGAARIIYTTWYTGPIGWDAAAAAGLWSSVTMTLSLLF